MKERKKKETYRRNRDRSARISEELRTNLWAFQKNLDGITRNIWQENSPGIHKSFGQSRETGRGERILRDSLRILNSSRRTSKSLRNVHHTWNSRASHHIKIQEITLPPPLPPPKLFVEGMRNIDQYWRKSNRYDLKTTTDSRMKLLLDRECSTRKLNYTITLSNYNYKKLIFFVLFVWRVIKK